MGSHSGSRSLKEKGDEHITRIQNGHDGADARQDVRALGRQALLDSLQPAITISPLQMLKSTHQRQRAGSPHKSKPPVA